MDARAARVLSNPRFCAVGLGQAEVVAGAGGVHTFNCSGRL